MSSAKLVITDSGGIQEETTILGIPCITLRENTERPVTTTQGTNVIVGTNPRKIVEECMSALKGNRSRKRIPAFWDGKAGDRIVSILAGGILQSK
jgi:UDP-N-acetylglucosamine 2-epimerase (non-hydrolysing)